VSQPARSSKPEQAFARWTPWIVWMPWLGLPLALAWSARFGFGAPEAWTLAVGYVVTLAGVEIGFHRHFAHQAFLAHPLLRQVLGIAGSMAAQGPLTYWVSNHLRHHALADGPGDPHSPHHPEARLRGLVHAHTGWILDVDLEQSYAYMPPACARDPVMKSVNRLFLVWLVAGLTLPALIVGLARGSLAGAISGFLWGGLVRILLVDQAVFVVNSVGHRFGRRRFATRDRSTNSLWLSLVTLGGSWHNNHHAAPASAKNGAVWWELDPSWWLIAALEAVGVVWNVRRSRRL
jgi:stearoyl-CoA desaturase (delta-9 desaturase)